MKQAEILKILAKDLKSKSPDLLEVNKTLKAKDAPKIKYRLSGKKLGHYGFTGLLKALNADGVKVYDVNKVTLIPYDAIEKMEIAKPREKRIVTAKSEEARGVKPPAAKAPAGKGAPKKMAAAALENDDDDDDDDDLDDDDDGFDEDFVIEKKRKRPRPVAGQNGSKYIPKKK